MAEPARPRPRHTPVALTIAGSDSGGGAGIQADLKAFARCGVHGTSAITAITAQNTVGVSAIQEIPAEIILAQVRAVLEDIGVDAVKVGMLGGAAAAGAVARALSELPAGTPVVVDPVMVAESGASLLDDAAREVLVREILPRASVITPNLLEAQALAGVPSGAGGADVAAPSGVPSGAGEPDVAAPSGVPSGAPEPDVAALARALLALGPGAVVVTGGHRDSGRDLFLSSEPPSEPLEIEGPRHAGGAAHGSGCTHSSVLAAQLALGRDVLQAARTARALAGDAVGRGLHDVGAGPGPVDVLDLAALRADPGA